MEIDCTLIVESEPIFIFYLEKKKENNVFNNSKKNFPIYSFHKGYKYYQNIYLVKE
jgi:hypothetical protein